MRILMILTAGCGERSSRSLTLEQVIEAYYLLRDSGTEVVIASSRGGDPPIRGGRKHSRQGAYSSQRLQSERGARDAVSDTLKLEQIYPEEFDGVICIGALEDPDHLADVEAARRLLGQLLAAGKPAAIIPSELELGSQGAFEGLLIAGEEMCRPSMAAKAILAALNNRGHRRPDSREGHC
jgi:glycine/D-amino acid oxidase-like deaminating enzyme